MKKFMKIIIGIAGILLSVMGIVGIVMNHQEQSHSDTMPKESADRSILDLVTEKLGTDDSKLYLAIGILLLVSTVFLRNKKTNAQSE